MKADILRYSCQITLPGFGTAAQEKLQQSKVLIIGAGGLGCPAALYLASSGIGTLGIADYDIVSVSNLHRQVLYGERDAGSKKAAVACKKLRQQNPHIQLVEHDVKVMADNVFSLLEPYDIIVDATDNFDTRYLINDACVLSGKPVVYGAIYQYEGQVAVWNVEQPDGTRTPHYRDIFPEVNAAQIPDCAEGGVIPPIAGIIGCMQANEVIKYLTATGELLSGKILLFDAASMLSRIIKIGNTSNAVVTGLPEMNEVPTVSIYDLKISSDVDRYELIDVRNADERKIFNIGGKHIPVNELGNNIDYLSHNKPILFYCASGKRSAEAVKKIKKVFPSANVFSLEGGMKAWRETI